MSIIIIIMLHTPVQLSFDYRGCLLGGQLFLELSVTAVLHENVACPCVAWHEVLISVFNFYVWVWVLLLVRTGVGIRFRGCVNCFTLCYRTQTACPDQNTCINVSDLK